MMLSTKSSIKPHAVFIPFPLQGHITPMMKLAQVFHCNGFHITFINTEFIHNRLGTRSKLSDFEFKTFRDRLAKEHNSAIKDLLHLCEQSRNNFLIPLQKVVSEVNLKDNTPPVSCIISDIQMPFTTKIALDIGVPSMLFWTASACSLTVYKHYYHLRDRGIGLVRDENLDDVIDCIPGLQNIKVKDLPFLGESIIDFPMKEVDEAVKASGIIVNSFDSLEEDVLSAISNLFPQVYAIGPLQMLTDSTLNGDSKAIISSLWEEEYKCLKWLDSMKPSSVIYISFGSLLDLTLEQFNEFAHGILNSNTPFLWITKSSWTNNDLSMKIQKKGFITNWCPQEKVLKHPAIGGFITHGGWNSILDSICAGVPIICCPFWADQQINSRYSCTTWGIGLEMDNVFKKDEVEKLVRELMTGERGINMKKKVMELKKLTIEAVIDRGSSSLQLGKLLSDATSRYDEPMSMEEKLQALVTQVINTAV